MSRGAVMRPRAPMRPLPIVRLQSDFVEVHRIGELKKALHVRAQVVVIESRSRGQ